jgi:hypothetical protein
MQCVLCFVSFEKVVGLALSGPVCAPISFALQ